MPDPLDVIVRAALRATCDIDDCAPCDTDTENVVVAIRSHPDAVLAALGFEQVGWVDQEKARIGAATLVHYWPVSEEIDVLCAKDGDFRVYAGAQTDG